MTDRRSRLFLFVIALVLLAIALPAAAKIYKWTDSEGNVHYSDEPVEGAETVDPPPVPVYESPQRAMPPRRDNRRPAEERDRQAAYQQFAIAQPANEATIRDAQQTVVVRLTIAPQLYAGHTVEITLDGQTVASGRQARFILEPVYRGSHQLQAVVRDSSGQVVTRTDTVTFFKHQPTVN